MVERRVAVGLHAPMRALGCPCMPFSSWRRHRTWLAVKPCRRNDCSKIFVASRICEALTIEIDSLVAAPSGTQQRGKATTTKRRALTG